MSTMPTPLTTQQYHVFLACPRDMEPERNTARAVFEKQITDLLRVWGIRFEVLTGEDVTSGGIGRRPEEHVIEETMQTHRASLVLFIGLMGSRFGSSTGVCESGTEEEFNWALKWALEHGWPEIKFFFRDPTAADINCMSEKSSEQWQRVCAFRDKISGSVFTRKYEAGQFAQMFSRDLLSWLSHPDRPWIKSHGQPAISAKSTAKEVGEALRAKHRLFQNAALPTSGPYVQPSIQWKGSLIDPRKLLEERTRKDGRTKPHVVISPPGAGKSLLLSHLQSAVRGQAPESLVVLINLGSMPAKDLPEWPENLLKQYLRNRHQQRVVARCFEDNNVYLFLDGLDEFAVGNKESVPLLVDRCRDLARRGIAVTLACRAWYWLHSAMHRDFEVAELNEFDNAQALEFLGKCSSRLPRDAFSDDCRETLKPWVLNPKVLSFIRDAQADFVHKTGVFDNWVKKVASTDLTRLPTKELGAEKVLDFFGELAVFLTKERVREISRNQWKKIGQDLGSNAPTQPLSYDEASEFSFLARRTACLSRASGPESREVKEESSVFSHALMWEYFVAYQLARDFRKLIDTDSGGPYEKLALAKTAIDFVPSSVYGFLSEGLGLCYLRRLLLWLKEPPVSLDRLPPRLLFNLIEYVGKTAQPESNAIETMLEILKNQKLDRIGTEGDPATLVRYNAARALERLHAGAPQPYFDWSSDWGVADWAGWHDSDEEWKPWAIRGSRLQTRKPNCTPVMDIDFDKAKMADSCVQREVCNVLMEILETTKDLFLRINCSHALVRWYDYTDFSLDLRLGRLIDTAVEEPVRDNLSRWVRKAAWRLR